MNSTLEYMAYKHRLLETNYRTPDNEHKENCMFIAIDLAKLLFKEDKIPYISLVCGKSINLFKRLPIRPKQYSGRIIWDVHAVCCESELVYDPMVSSNPVSIENYCKNAFYEDIDFKVIIDKDKIEDFLKMENDIIWP